MFTVNSYPLAVVLCVITMLCWDSWANTQKLASREWPFQLFYSDYALGVVILALLLVFTLGSTGQTGRAFVADLAQADGKWLGSAFLGGVFFDVRGWTLHMESGPTVSDYCPIVERAEGNKGDDGNA